MSKKEIVFYKITVTNFERHNPHIKKSHKKTLISNNFCWDDKLVELPLSIRWLFLGLLLSCGEVGRESIETTPKTLRTLLGQYPESIETALLSLQSLQLLTFEKSAPLELNRNEMNRNEKKRSSQGVEKDEVPFPEKPLKPDKNLNAEIWESYRSAYLQRYKVEPLRNAAVNSKISQIGKRLGADGVSIVKFYLSHNDPFYLAKTHDIGLCLSNAESLHTQWKKGRAISMKDAKEFERKDHYSEQLRKIENGEI